MPPGSYDLSNGALTITQNLDIAGAGATSTTVVQASKTPDRVFDVEVPAVGTVANLTVPTVTISGLTIEGGTSPGGPIPGPFGGDVLNCEANLTLSEDLITDGTAHGGAGGGISNDGGTMTVTHSLVYGNKADASGGAIQNYGYGEDMTHHGILQVDNSTIADNSSSLGGGIFSWNDPDNQTTITNSTISYNDGGLLAEDGSTITVQNSIVAFNTIDEPTTGTASNCGVITTAGLPGGTIISKGYNLESGTDCGFKSTGDLQDANPLFTSTSPQDNGGSTGTLSIAATSPAVDAIPIGAPGCSGTDQRGVTRPQGTGCDIGAVELVPQPAVTAVTPSSGPLSGGTSVTITGTNLQGETAIEFGSSAASNVMVDSNTEITATSPAGSAGTVNVTVTTPGGTSATGSSDDFIYIAAPTVTGVSPSGGPSAGGTAVSITGTNLAGATAVRFGAAAASSFTVSSATSITATSPAAAVGPVDITVTTAGGTSATGSVDRFTYTTAPAVPAVTPPSGPAGGGTSLEAPAVTAVTTAGLPVVQGVAGVGFSGTVNPEGQATTAYFEYGLDPKYTGGGPVLYSGFTQTQPVGSGLSAQFVSTSVSGLVPDALYHVRLVATNGAGTAVGPDETFITLAGPAPPPPTLGKTVNVAPVSGVVYIKLPAKHAADGPDDVLDDALLKGQGFVPLTETRQIPSGSQIDARQGILTMVSAPPTKHGKLEKVTLNGAIFSVTQSRTGVTKGLTTLTLLEGDFPGAPSYASCPKAAADNAAADSSVAQAAKASPKVLQTLKASDNHGQYRTSGRYSSASVLGTQWTTSDRCDGTLTSVQRGTVDVYDFATRKTIVVHAHHSYLAKAVKSRHS